METFSLEFRNLRRSVLLWTISLAAVIFLLLAFFPSMQTDAMRELANAKLEAMPTAVLAMFGLAKIPDLTQIFNYFGYVIQYINMALCVFAASKGLNMLIREETEGTIEYLYAKPVTRKQIMLQKTLANVLGITLVVAGLWAVTLLSYQLFTQMTLADSLREVSHFYLGTLFVSLVFLCAGILLSAVIPSSRQVASTALALVFVTFFFGVISVLVKPLSFLIHLSPLDWVKATGGTLGPSAAHAGIGLCLMLVSLAGCLLLYDRKDLLI